MKKKLFLLLITVFFVTQDSYAFLGIDAALGAISRTTKAAYDQVHQKIIQANWIIQLKTIKQNYEQSKRYYDEMRRLREHRGGIPGYFNERVNSDLSQINQEEYWKMQNWLGSDPEETAYVRKWAEKTDEIIKRKLDFSDKLHEIGKKRDNELEKVADMASKKKLSQEELNEYNKRTDILQLEYLASIDKGIQKLLRGNAEEIAKEWEWIKKQKIAAEKERERIEAIYKERQQSRERKDPIMVLEEIPQ